MNQVTEKKISPRVKGLLAYKSHETGKIVKAEVRNQNYYTVYFDDGAEKVMKHKLHSTHEFLGAWDEYAPREQV